MLENSAKVNPVRFQRLAEQVADDLRTRILVGDLADGAELPIEEDLRAQYPVSKPTLREAMRVLEAEGLVTVRRGAIGGAVVQQPTADHVAYSLGLVLSGRRVGIDDVGLALQEVGPACAASCAQREDRNETVVPTLRLLHEKSLRVVDDLVEVTLLSRMFHETLVELCGNESLAVLAGALESLWSAHESAWADSNGGLVDIPKEERLHALEEHHELIQLISAGDVEGARAAAAAHLLTSQTYPNRTAGSAISPAFVRSTFMQRSKG